MNLKISIICLLQEPIFPFLVIIQHRVYNNILFVVPLYDLNTFYLYRLGVEDDLSSLTASEKNLPRQQK